MIALPPDHHQRSLLAAEVHARPPEALQSPSAVSYVAVLIADADRERERAHLVRLHEVFATPTAEATADHISVDFGPLRFKWERHGEWSGYTFIAQATDGPPFAHPPMTLLPEHWMAEVPGTTIFAAHAHLARLDGEPPAAERLANHFDGNVAVGAEIADGAGFAFADFRIHGDGFERFLLFDRRLTPRQAGRIVQRLFEIEAYRTIALLALPIAREQSPRTVAIERSLAAVTEEMAMQGSHDESLLQQLSRLAAEVERSLVASQFRFGACRAYHDLVLRRIAELRERRIEGVQTIEEFMVRRFTPAAATCASASQRLHDLSERVAQASALLSTRVGIARERQNQGLLASMNRRASLQLRLQQTVEVLSVAAIVYYVVGLIGYIAKALNTAGLSFNPDIAVGVAVIPVAALAAYVLRRVHRKILGASSDSSAGNH